MAAPRLSLLAAWLLWSTPAAADPVARWAPQIAEASQLRYTRRVDQAGHPGGERRGTARGGSPIVSSAGAIGLMQLMPGTRREMRARLGFGADPHDPRDNILAGTAYLRMMYDRFGYPGLFAAYNAGPARYARLLSCLGGVDKLSAG